MNGASSPRVLWTPPADVLSTTEAGRYVRWLERELRCPAAIVSVGASHEQTFLHSEGSLWG